MSDIVLILLAFLGFKIISLASVFVEFWFSDRDLRPKKKERE